MTDTLPACPKCASEYTYELGALLACPLCAHEWTMEEADALADTADPVVKDAFGTPLADGDNVTVIKDLRVKGSQSVIKVGTKVRGIRLVDGIGDHDIDCRVDGIGQTQLKSSVVKKA